MNNKRVLQKGIAYNHKAYIFGGSETDGIEIYDSSTNTWKEDKSQSFSIFVSPQDIDLFSYSQPPVTVPDQIPIIPKINQHYGINNSTSTVKEEENDEYSPNNGVINSNGLNKDQVKRNSEGKIVSIEQELSPITKSLIKEDLLIEKSYLFGTDVDPFILEIDYLNVSVEKKSVPLSIRLFQHQGVAYIKEKSTIVLMGGVHDGMNKTVHYTYTLDQEKFTGQRVQNMIVGAYAFATLTMYPYIYAIGGKQSADLCQSASNNPVILNTTQRFNIETMKWEKLPNLNVKRVSAMATNFFNKIYVFGGFKGDIEQIRPNEIEVYNPDSPVRDSKNQPVWEVISVKFPIGLEGAPMLSVSQINQQQPEILLFGGRTSSGEITYISKLSLNVEYPEKQKKLTENEEDLDNHRNHENGETPEAQEDEEEDEEEPTISLKLDKVSQMLQSRCLHKVIQPYKNFALILGGQYEPLVECVNLSKNYTTSPLSQVPHIDLIVQKLSSSLKKVKDHTLKQYSFSSC